MVERLSDLNHLRTFTVVAEQRRVARAAEVLRLPKSTVSRHVSKLEEDLGYPLFDRRSDGLQLTPKGRRLFERVRNAVNTLSRGLLESSDLLAERRVRIQAPAIYARGVLRDALTDYLSAHPDAALDIELEARFAVPNPDRHDIIFFVGQAPGSSFEIWTLPHVEARLYAAPGLFAGERPPAQVDDLRKWPLLTNHCVQEGSSTLDLYDGKKEVSASFSGSRLIAPDPDMLLASALEGLGIARLPTFCARPHVEAGALVPILDGLVADFHSVTMARSHRNTNPHARGLAKYLFERISSASPAK